MSKKNFFIRKFIYLIFIIFLFFYYSQYIPIFNGNIIQGQAQPKLNQGIWIEYVESNSYYDPNEPSKVYFAENLFDNLYETAWVSQSKVREPTIKIYFHIPMTFSSLYVKNGVGEENSQDFVDNGKVKTLQLRTKYKSYNFSLSDNGQWQKLTFETITVDYIELVVLDFYPGKRWFTIGMSEISFDFPSSFQITDITSKGQNLYSWMLQNIPLNVPKDKIQYTKLLNDYVKAIISNIGIPVADSTTLREQAFPYFAFIGNRKFLPFSIGFPRNEDIKRFYSDAFGTQEFIKYQIDAFSPSYFFSIYANALQPYAAMMSKSLLLNSLNSNEPSIFNDKYYMELLLHALILGMDLRSNYYKQKYGNIKIANLPITARIQFTFYRLLRSLRNCPYLPIKFYETVMLEDPMELSSYIEMLVKYIENKEEFQRLYLEGGEVVHLTYNNDDFFVASIGNVDEFGQFAISMYLHNEDLIRYFKNIISTLPYSQETIMELSKILIESNYYAKRPERQYY